MLRIAAFLLACSALAPAAATYCDAPSEVQAELRRSAALWDAGLRGDKLRAAQREILAALVQRFPDDIQANRRYQNDSGIPKEELIAVYKKRLDAQPGDPLSLYLYALVLATRDPGEAETLFRQALAKDPNMAWPHMALAYEYASGRKPDKAKATQEVDAFFTKCPTSYDFYTNRMLGTYGSPDLRKKVTEALRARVDAETDPAKLGIFEHLWPLEFKTTPPSEHAALRQRIAADVQRLRTAIPQPPLAILRLMRDGLRQANDTAGALRLEDEMVARFPQWTEGARIVRDRWYQAHPEPGPNATAAERAAWAKLLFANAKEWTLRWPTDPIARLSRFMAALMLKDLPPEALKAAIDGLLDFLQQEPNAVYGFQPFQHQAAEEYLRRGIYIDLVPGLAEAGLATVEKRLIEQRKEAARLPQEIVKRMEEPAAAARLAAVSLLAQARLSRKQPAGDLEARLQALPVPEQKANWFRAASYVAQALDRHMDAFVYQEKALEASPRPGNTALRELDAEQRTRLRALWTAAGGTEATWALRAKPAPVGEATSTTPWQKPAKPIPASWQLTDLAGRQWTAEALAGKTVLINVWATWCGPCRAEHPHLQKLYTKLKDRADFVLVSFNVDDQPGLVEGYLKEGNFTFPALLAQDFVHRHTDSLAIPQNWLFDAQGRHRLTQEGFAESADWENSVLQAIANASAPLP